MIVSVVETSIVATVTVWVATPYVNLSIWSILQRKRIRFLWRLISFAGTLSLSLSHSTSLLFSLCLLLIPPPPPPLPYHLGCYGLC